RSLSSWAGNRRDGRTALSPYRDDPQVRRCAVRRSWNWMHDRDPFQRIADTRARRRPGIVAVDGTEISHRRYLDGDLRKNRWRPRSDCSADDLHRDYGSL